MRYLNNNTYLYKDLALVVLSSKDYNYLWPIFIRSWEQFFNQSKLKKYIVTINFSSILKKFHIISPDDLNEKSPWSQRISKAIKNIKQDKLLVFTDDCILINHVKFNYFEKIFFDFKKNNFDHLRLYVEKDIKKKNDYVFLDYYTFHRLSLQPGLWKKSFFLKCLNKGDFNPREFETFSSLKTLKKDKIFSITNAVFDYIELIRAGKLTPKGKNFFLKTTGRIPKGFTCSNLKESLLYYYKELKAFIFYLAPNFLRKMYIKKRFNTLN